MTMYAFIRVERDSLNGGPCPAYVNPLLISKLVPQEPAKKPATNGAPDPKTTDTSNASVETKPAKPSPTEQI